TGSVGGPITLRMNAAGIAYAGWPEFDGSYWTAWTAKWIPATGWGVPAELDAGPGDSGQVVVQPNDGGTALAAWYHSNNGVWEVKAENNVYGWGVAPIQLSASGGEAAFPDVAVSHYGQYAIGWQEWDGAKWNVVVQRFDVFLNALSPATPIRAEDDYADGVHLGVDGAGDVFASWREGPQDGVLTPMANRYVIRDGTPSLTVFSPTPGLYNTGVFTIQGFTDPGAQIVIDGVNVVVDVSGYFVDVVTLPDGPHYFQILAYNAAGSYTVQNILVDVDTIAPPLTITSPLFGLTNVPNVWVSGTTEPGATVDVDGITATVDAAGNFGLTEGMVEGSNTFIVTATDPAGNSVMRTLRVTLDTIPPPLTIFSPAGGVTNNPTVIIAGQTEAGASVTINGAPVTPDAFGAFQQVIGEPDGYHAFTIAATDAAGNAATAPASITVDTTVPGLAITSPSTGLLTNRPLVTVTGTVDPAASVVVNGFVVANAGGTFSVPMPLAEGANTIRATATDPAGNTASATITVTLDTRAPNLVLTTPQNLGNGGFVITNNNAVAIAGTTEPGASVTINAIPVPVGPTGAFTYTITEPDGYHTFTIVATDAAGNVASTSITVAVDTTPPPLAVAAPADGLLTATPTVIVRGTTETGARVTVNGVQAVVDVNGAFAVSLVLAEGANTIRVDATDVSGNTAMDTRSVTLDRVPPVLVLTGPADGTLTNVRNVVVSGFTEPRATVMIDGTAVTVGGTGLFTRTVTLSDGPHVFDVLASDAAGNEAETLVTVTVDTVAPALAITSPASGAATTDGSIVVSGTSEAGAHLVVNGVAVNVASDGTFSARIALAPGSNPITAIATDAAGNSATAPPVTVTFNDPVPGLRNDLTNTQNSLNATKGDLATTQGDLAAARQSLSSLSTEALGLLALAAVALVLGVLQFVQIRGLRKQMMRTNPERERRSEPPST
ncbi:MAG TPA: Ig-like domain-containing protein, partial [Thermoplasmata archaeon]|nr:Ig-like domain-containing protein [Thermoplasmata archaeon]